MQSVWWGVVEERGNHTSEMGQGTKPTQTTTLSKSERYLTTNGDFFQSQYTQGTDNKIIAKWMEDMWIAVNQTNEVALASTSYLSETFWMFYILQVVREYKPFLSMWAQLVFQLAGNAEAWEEKMPPSDALTGQWKAVLYHSQRASLPPFSPIKSAHTSKRWLMQARSALKSVEPQVAKSWAGAGEETGNQTARHLLRLQRSNSIGATHCLGAKMVSELPPFPTRLPVRHRHHAGSRDTPSAQFQAVTSVTWDWTWDIDR